MERPKLPAWLRDPRDGLVAVVLVLLFAAGAVLRLDAASRHYGPDEIQQRDVRRYYASAAESLLAGRGLTPDLPSNFVPPPLQALFLAAVKAVPGASYGTARAVQAWLSALGTLLAFAIGLQLGGRVAGLVAAGLVAFDAELIHYASTLLAESNFVVLLLAFLAALLWALPRAGAAGMLAAGALLGLASLARPQPLLLALLVPGFVAVRERGRRGAGLVRALAFLLGCCAVVAPWTARNHLRHGGLHLVSTNAGTLLAQSNHPGLDPRETPYWESARARGAWQSPEIERRFRGVLDADGRSDWNAKDRAYLEHTLRYVAREPGHFLRNYALKLANVLLLARPVPGVVAGLLGAVWFAWAERRRPAWIAVWMLAYTVAFTALFHLLRSGRTLLSVRVLLLLFAAYAVAAALRGLRGRWAPGP